VTSTRWPLHGAMVYGHRPIGQAGRCILCGRLTVTHGGFLARLLFRVRGGNR
jgi:hypothetical protein